MRPASSVLAAALALFALALTLALPTAATAEGGRIVLDCVGEDGTATTFVIAPAKTDATGKGPIEVTYEGRTYPGVTSSDRGPFQFGTDDEHFAILIQGPTDDGTLAVQLHHARGSSSTLTPYTCETDL